MWRPPSTDLPCLGTARRSLESVLRSSSSRWHSATSPPPPGLEPCRDGERDTDREMDCTNWLTLSGSGPPPLTWSPPLQSSSSPPSTSTAPTSPWEETTASCLSRPVGGCTVWTATTPLTSSGTYLRNVVNVFHFGVQVRVGGIQLAVLAGPGPRDSRQELLPACPRAGADTALPRPGRPRVTGESLVGHV